MVLTDWEWEVSPMVNPQSLHRLYNATMAQDEGKEEKKFEFDAAGEDPTQPPVSYRQSSFMA